MSCTGFFKRLACICTETAAVDGAVNKQLDTAQQIAAGPTPAHKVLIKKQVKKELAKAKPEQPAPIPGLFEPRPQRWPWLLTSIGGQRSHSGLRRPSIIYQ